MVAKIVNIADYSVFNEYSKRYNIFRDLYDPTGVAIEFFDITDTQIGFLKNSFINKKLIFYLNPASGNNSLLVLGVFNELTEISSDLISNGDEELGNAISKLMDNIYCYDKIKYKLGEKEFSTSSILIQGILNVTPDSFSDGGKYNSFDKAFDYVVEMVKDGVDIVDIGGESTRPGAETVSEEEEIDRVIPIIEKLHSEFPDLLISIDTYKSKVAETALNAGAKIINDISGGTFDDRMFDVAAQYNSAIILMHIKGKPKNMQVNPHYDNLIYEVYDFLSTQIKKARNKGIETIIADPGIGFGKRLHDNYELIKRFGEFKGLGVPLLIGLSKKSFLGNALDIQIDQREIPTIISETFAAINGARIIRTHNVQNAVYLKKLFNFYNDFRQLIK